MVTPQGSCACASDDSICWFIDSLSLHSHRVHTPGHLLPITSWLARMPEHCSSLRDLLFPQGRNTFVPVAKCCWWCAWKPWVAATPGFPKSKAQMALLAAGQYARVAGDRPQHLPPTWHGLCRNHYDNNIRATRLDACPAVANQQRTVLSEATADFSKGLPRAGLQWWHSTGTLRKACPALSGHFFFLYFSFCDHRRDPKWWQAGHWCFQHCSCRSVTTIQNKGVDSFFFYVIVCVCIISESQLLRTTSRCT